MFVSPKRDCPHVYALDYEAFPRKDLKIDSPCEEDGCEATGENWICCFCGKITCSRYVAGHAAEHAEKNPDHCIAVSFADCSCWCYKCDSYIDDAISRSFVRLVQHAKFGDPTPAPAAPVTIAEAIAAAQAPLKESLINHQNDAFIGISECTPDEGLLIEDCNRSVFKVSSPLRSIRANRCKKCTIEIVLGVTSIEICNCEELTIRKLTGSARSTIRIEDTFSSAVILSVPPETAFFSHFETKGSNVAISSESGCYLITKGPRSSTVYDKEKKAFVTTTM